MRKIFQFYCLLGLAAVFAPAASLNAQVYLNYNVNQPAVLAADAGADVIICTGGNTILGGTNAASGGYGGYVYGWAPSASLNNATLGNPTASPLVSTFYMLQVNDSMGCTAMDTIEVVVDTCIGISGFAGVESFEVFPNPNDGNFTVAIDLQAQIAKLQLSIVDLTGKMVYQKEVVAPSVHLKEQISLNGISRGTYFIRMEADGKLLSRKMILR